MSKLTAITASGYRGFADPVTLELRPLTLLYGWNNSGKSALLRLLPLLCEAVEPRATAPLHLSSDLSKKLTRESSFFDLRTKVPPNRTQPPLRFEFHFQDAPLSRIVYEIGWESPRSFVKTMMAFQGDTPAVVLRHTGKLPPWGVRAEYEAGPAPQRSVLLSFAGLLPEALPEVPVLADVWAQMSSLQDAVQWLGPVRRVERDYNAGSSPRRLAHDGADAPDVLRQQNELLLKVSEWYASLSRRHGSSLASEKRIELVDATPKKYRVLLQSTDAPDVDLVDSGEGLIQVFPVLVAIEMARAEGGPRIVAVEEAESHLHPDGQRHLAEHLCAVAAGKDPPYLVLETHSRVLMLAVQFQLAQQKIDPSQVIAYWVQQQDGKSHADRVTFNDLGEPETGWPIDVFAEDRRLAQGLAEKQQSREDEADPRRT